MISSRNTRRFRGILKHQKMKKVMNSRSWFFFIFLMLWRVSDERTWFSDYQLTISWRVETKNHRRFAPWCHATRRVAWQSKKIKKFKIFWFFWIFLKFLIFKNHEKFTGILFIPLQSVSVSIKLSDSMEEKMFQKLSNISKSQYPR
jgi:hypothetical protein